MVCIIAFTFMTIIRNKKGIQFFSQRNSFLSNRKHFFILYSVHSVHSVHETYIQIPSANRAVFFKRLNAIFSMSSKKTSYSKSRRKLESIVFVNFFFEFVICCSTSRRNRQNNRKLETQKPNINRRQKRRKLN